MGRGEGLTYASRSISVSSSTSTSSNSSCNLLNSNISLCIPLSSPSCSLIFLAKSKFLLSSFSMVSAWVARLRQSAACLVLCLRRSARAVERAWIFARFSSSSRRRRAWVSRMVFSMRRRWSSSEEGESEAMRESMSSSVRRASSTMDGDRFGMGAGGGGMSVDEGSFGAGVVGVDMVDM